MSTESIDGSAADGSAADGSAADGLQSVAAALTVPMTHPRVRTSSTCYRPS
jgi:hypothetical protein